MWKFPLAIVLLCIAQAAFAFDLQALKDTVAKPSDLNHLATFERVADEILKTSIISDQQDKISLLYPGAGSHIAVLRIGQRIKEARPQLKTIQFVLTDIDEEASQRFEGYLRTLASNSQGIDQITTKTTSFDQGKEIEISFQDTRAKAQYRILYALDRSNPVVDRDQDLERAFYYQQSYFDDSQIIVHHDSSNDRQPSTFMADFLTSLNRYLAQVPAADAERKAFVFEDVNTSKYLTEGATWATHELLPGTVARVNGDYGCRSDAPDFPAEDDHIGEARFTGAIVFAPDYGFWSKLSSFEIKSLVLFAYTNHYPDTGPFLKDGLYNIRLTAYPETLSRIYEALDRIPGIIQELPFASSYLPLFKEHLQISFESEYPRPTPEPSVQPTPAASPAADAESGNTDSERPEPLTNSYMRLR